MDARVLLALAVFVSSSAVAQLPVRDPFATLSEQPNLPAAAALNVNQAATQGPSLELKAILWGDNPLANISGMIVAPGDKVYNYTVQQLSRKTAVLRSESSSITLVLDEDS